MGTKTITYDERICLSLNPKFYYDKKRKCNHKKNKTRLWCKIVLQTTIEHIEHKRGPTFTYTHLRT
jgi:hypothetical protein